MVLSLTMILRLLCCFSFSLPAFSAELEKFIFEKAEMGVPFRITLYAENQNAAKIATDAAFARIEALNAILSDYEDDSELTHLSRTHGQAVKVSDTLWYVLSRSQSLAEKSEGAFDITCGPLTNIWRRARRKKELPTPELIAEMRQRTGWRNLKLNEAARTAELLLPNMRLDLGAIAKGYACDEALKTLRVSGHGIALVAGSGDMAAGDAPPGRKGWRIEVATLDEKKPCVVELVNAAIATSGDSYQYLEIEGKRYSHIIDVRTGEPLNEHSLVSIIASDCITADSLATTCSVLGSEKSKGLVEAYNVAAKFQRQQNNKISIVESQGWQHWLTP
jgi:FAD:protein FMN transferase